MKRPQRRPIQPHIPIEFRVFDEIYPGYEFAQRELEIGFSTALYQSTLPEALVRPAGIVLLQGIMTPPWEVTEYVNQFHQGKFYERRAEKVELRAALIKAWSVGARELSLRHLGKRKDLKSVPRRYHFPKPDELFLNRMLFLINAGSQFDRADLNVQPTYSLVVGAEIHSQTTGNDLYHLLRLGIDWAGLRFPEGRGNKDNDTLSLNKFAFEQEAPVIFIPISG